MDEIFNFIFWFNSYEGIWYAISRDTQLDFFNGHRERSVHYKSKEITTLIEIINKGMVNKIK